MYKRRILQLADTIERVDAKKFDQTTWGFTNIKNKTYNEPTCETPACIAGWACAMFGPEMDVPADISFVAQKLLGLTSGQADMLFEGTYIAQQNSPSVASKVLRHLAATGKVNWNIE